MTAESENWTTAQSWVFLRSYMTSIRFLRYGHEKNVTISTKKMLFKCITEPFQTTITFT